MYEKTIEELVDEIRRASKAYYAGASIVSDQHFDQLVEHLRQLDPAHKTLDEIGWGYNPDSDKHLKKFPHFTKIGSLDKIKHDDVIAGRTPDYFDYFIASLKLDGGSAIAYYDKGNLVRVLSRGNGLEGLDITKNVLVGKTIPTKIKDSRIVAIRGEIVITYKSFNTLKGSSPRNRAVGLSQSIHSSKDELEHLKFIAYDIPVRMKGTTIIDKISDLNRLEDLGFLVVPWQIYNGWINFVADASNGNIDLSNWSYLPSVLENRFSRGTFRENIPVDGLVLTRLDYVLVEVKEHVFPEYKSIAYKFHDESASTSVRRIEWTLSRTGRMIPVAIVEPVEISGATIKRVTLNNFQWLEELQAGIGADIEIVRSNMVIPMIVDVHQRSLDYNAPMFCPYCPHELKRVGVDLVCANMNCPYKQEVIVRAILTHVMPDGLGETTLDTLIKEFNLDELSELAKFRNEVMEEHLTIFGPHYTKLIMRMVCSLRDLKLTPGQILQLASIPQVGNKVREKIDTHVRFSYFRDALGRKKPGESWKQYMNAPAFENLNRLWSRVEAIVNFVGVENVIDPFIKSIPLTKPKIKVTITGGLSMPRKELVKELNVEEVPINQAEVLIADVSSSSSKYKKAMEREIPILTEEEFRDKYI